MDDAQKKITDEFIENITLPFKSRFDDPIIGTYIGSFLLFNWKIILIIFSSKDIAEKIDWIENHLLGNNIDFNTFSYFLTSFMMKISSLFSSFVFPAITTYLILFFIPKKLKLYYDKINTNRVDRLNAAYTAQLNLKPTERIIKDLISKHEFEIARNNELQNDKQIDKNMIVRLEKELKDKESSLDLEKDQVLNLSLELDTLRSKLETCEAKLKLQESELESARRNEMTIQSKKQRKFSTEDDIRVEIAVEKLRQQNLNDQFIEAGKSLFLKNQSVDDLDPVIVQEFIKIDLIEIYEVQDYDGTLRFCKLSELGKKVFHKVAKYDFEPGSGLPF